MLPESLEALWQHSVCLSLVYFYIEFLIERFSSPYISVCSDTHRFVKYSTKRSIGEIGGGEQFHISLVEWQSDTSCCPLFVRWPLFVSFGGFFFVVCAEGIVEVAGWRVPHAPCTSGQIKRAYLYNLHTFSLTHVHMLHTIHQPYIRARKKKE